MPKAMPERNFRSQGTAPLAQLDKRRSAEREVAGSNPSRTNTELWSDINNGIISDTHVDSPRQILINK